MTTRTKIALTLIALTLIAPVSSAPVTLENVTPENVTPENVTQENVTLEYTHTDACYELRADLLESDYDSGSVSDMLQANGCDSGGVPLSYCEQLENGCK